MWVVANLIEFILRLSAVKGMHSRLPLCTALWAWRSASRGSVCDSRDLLPTELARNVMKSVVFVGFFLYLLDQLTVDLVFLLVYWSSNLVPRIRRDNKIKNNSHDIENSRESTLLRVQIPAKAKFAPTCIRISLLSELSWECITSLLCVGLFTLQIGLFTVEKKSPVYGVFGQ